MKPKSVKAAFLFIIKLKYVIKQRYVIKRSIILKDNYKNCFIEESIRKGVLI